MASEIVINSDILVIGGGMAGIFAAIKASEQGVSVTLVDKGYAGKSGQTPFACGYAVFNPAWGDSLKDWLSQVNTDGEYINNRAWTEILFRDSYARYQDLLSWGVGLHIDEEGPPEPMPNSTLMRLEWKVFGDILRRQALKRGVKIIDRCMATDMLKQDGRIVGIIGILMNSYDKCVIKAKATILCSGAGSFKPWGWPSSAQTSDGDAMAFRAGAEITGKEFVDTHYTYMKAPAYFGFSKLNASVTGSIAGEAASECAKSAGKAEIDPLEISRLTSIIADPLERKGGFSPRWVTQLLQNTMMPYFVLFVKKEDRLKAALTNIEFYRDHLLPLLYARDTHELRLAIETKNMVLNAEMKLKASLFRRESRGCHFREDFPRRQDPEWLAWVVLKNENGVLKAVKRPVPKQWWPDLSRTYRERYSDSVRFPGE